MKNMVLKYLLPFPEDPTTLTTLIEAPRDFCPLSVGFQESDQGRQVAVWGTCSFATDDPLETTPKCKHAFLVVPTGVEFSDRRMRFLGTVQYAGTSMLLVFHVFHILRGQ